MGIALINGIRYDRDTHRMQDSVSGEYLDELSLRANPLLDGRFLAGQPIGITRPVRNAGKLVCRFKAAEWTPYGTAVLADSTGYDANGNVTGVVSRTGHPTLLKVTPSDDSNEGALPVSMSTFVTTALNGLFGVWLFVETLPGYEAGGAGPSSSFTVDLSTTAGFGNHLSVNFNANGIKEGWNFLVFRMRNAAAYTSGSGVSENHPFGVNVMVIGTGASANILASPVAAMRCYFNGVGITGKNFYLDSMWTAFDTQAQLVAGYDAVDQSILDYALPIFNRYGWKGFFTVNGGYLNSGGTNRILVDYTINTGSAPKRYAILKAAGWDAINHGLMHLPGNAVSPNMAALTDPAEIAYEVMANHAIMRSLGLSKGTEFYAAPQNSSSRLTEKVIAGCGFKLQRCVRVKNTPVTPWGIPNPANVGSVGLGATGEDVYTITTGGVTTTEKFGSGGIGNLQRAKNLIDLNIDYGTTLFTYSHGLETSGDDGTGNTLPAVSSNCIESLNRLFLQYAYTKEQAGLLRVCDGFTGFYYGNGR